jgi:hypothetical protein
VVALRPEDLWLGGAEPEVQQGTGAVIRVVVVINPEVLR